MLNTSKSTAKDLILTIKDKEEKSQRGINNELIQIVRGSITKREKVTVN